MKNKKGFTIKKTVLLAILPVMILVSSPLAARSILENIFDPKKPSDWHLPHENYTLEIPEFSDMFGRSAAIYYAGRSGIKYEALKVYFQSPSWHYNKNDYGIVTSRGRRAAVGLKRPSDGKCFLAVYYFEQESGGPGEWGNLYVKFAHTEVEMLCENIK